jgi:hypothetical protein
MKNLTVIVPVHEFNDDIEVLLRKALNSFYETDTDKDTELLFVAPKKVLATLKDKYSKLDRTKFVESKNPDFCSQINTAVDSCREYFSILEFDDVYTPNWFKNVKEYFEEDESISVYLPLTEIVLFDKPEEGAIGYINEAPLATSFSEKLGFLDLESLLNYMNFNTTGGIFKTKDFIELGKLKEPIKLSFWYEFLLRAVRNDKKVYVIPKVGYVHTLNRENSLSEIYNKTMKPEEAEFWIELAQKDYLFKKTRDISHYIYE